MYGIVNKSLEELVKSEFGLDVWNNVKKRSGVDVDFFISNEPYDDDVTYKLAIAVSEEVNLPLGKVLYTFGEWWILKTTIEKYGGLMHSGGSSLKEFLMNLPEFHNHIMLMYPKLTPPEFKVSDLTENSIHVHYFSKRIGLGDFVNGLLMGLATMFNTPATVTLMESNPDITNHAVFKVTW
jgi:hypothetical protein